MNEKDFKCQRCGICCLHARFDEVHEEDIRSWEELGRTDVLQWVRYRPLGQGDFAYEVWIDPVTGEVAESCPWIEKKSNGGQYICRIYDVRPTICRYFPASRKHALEVGCKGFGQI
jgi:Fe-S-cluster containining protein